MHVILSMTGEAIHRQHRLGDVLGDVTGPAIESTMGSGQRVSRLRVVVEAPPLPAIRVVTKRAVWSQAAFMVPVAMAGVAIERRSLELQGTMATLAGHNGVASDQRKSSDIVIEGSSTPACLSVTLLATSSELSLVLVIFLVT